MFNANRGVSPNPYGSYPGQPSASKGPSAPPAQTPQPQDLKQAFVAKFVEEMIAKGEVPGRDFIHDRVPSKRQQYVEQSLHDARNLYAAEKLGVTQLDFAQTAVTHAFSNEPFVQRELAAGRDPALNVQNRAERSWSEKAARHHAVWDASDDFKREVTRWAEQNWNAIATPHAKALANDAYHSFHRQSALSLQPGERGAAAMLHQRLAAAQSSAAALEVSGSPSDIASLTEQFSQLSSDESKAASPDENGKRKAGNLPIPDPKGRGKARAPSASDEENDSLRRSPGASSVHASAGSALSRIPESRRSSVTEMIRDQVQLLKDGYDHGKNSKVMVTRVTTRVAKLNKKEGKEAVDKDAVVALYRETVKDMKFTRLAKHPETGEKVKARTLARSRKDLVDPENPRRMVSARELKDRSYRREWVPHPDLEGVTISRGELARLRFSKKKAAAENKDTASSSQPGGSVQPSTTAP